MAPMEFDCLEAVTLAERPELLEIMEPAIFSAFPEFLAHDRVWNECWPVLLDTWPELHLFLVEPTGAPVGMASAVPATWDGTLEGLPPGTHASMVRAVERRSASSGFDTACLVQAVMDPGHLGKGLGQAVMRASIEHARALGYERVISPIRPTAKQDYPTIPLSSYVHWRRPDGLPVDPWLRLQQRVGGTMLVVCDDSLVVEGTVSEWEAWTGLVFPESAEYVIPGGQEMLAIDREADHGRYAESHVWFNLA